MDISLNGQRVDVDAATLQELLQQRGYAPGTAIACAIKQEFVSRAQWGGRAWSEGDRIDVVAPITGG